MGENLGVRPLFGEGQMGPHLTQSRLGRGLAPYAYLLSNICTENYWNRTTVVEIIVGGWVVSLFETQCMYLSKQITLCSNK